MASKSSLRSGLRQHEAIVSRELWDRVQQQRRNRAARSGDGRKTEATRSPLAGKLFDESGEPLYVQGAAKGQRRYRYYVSKHSVRGESKGAEKSWRVSAPEIEKTISAAAQAMLADRATIVLALDRSAIADDQLESILRSAQRWIELLGSGDAALALSELMERVELSREGLQLSLKLPVPSEGAGDDPTSDHLSLVNFVPLVMKRRGVEMKMVLEGDKTLSRVDLPLLKAVARARRWSDDLLSGDVESVDALAKREGLDKRSVRRLIRLGFLSPRIVAAIIDGRQPPDLTVIALARRLDLPLIWSAQEQALGIR